MTLEEIYQQKCAEPSDINEHLPILREYARRCELVAEFGVRGIVSTWAFLRGLADNGRLKRGLVSYDISNPGEEPIKKVERLGHDSSVDFHFVKGDTRQIAIPVVDCLFIDTFHTFGQLRQELNLHASKVRKYIIVHDTETFGKKGEAGDEAGLLPAIEWFLNTFPEWKLHAQFYNKNGLTFLAR